MPLPPPPGYKAILDFYATFSGIWAQCQINWKLILNDWLLFSRLANKKIVIAVLSVG